MIPRRTILVLMLLAFAATALATPVQEPITFEKPSTEPVVQSRTGARADTLFLFAESGPGSFGSPGTDSRGFTFDYMGGPAPAGWQGVDLTIDDEVYWHLAETSICAGTGTDMSEALPFDTGDTVNDYALWCGSEDGCHWDSPPGYGNGWYQAAVLDLGQQMADSVRLRYVMSWDFEDPPYENLTVASWLNGEWNVLSASAVGGPVYDEFDWTYPAEVFGDDNWRLAFVFESDGGWSDEDGGYDSDVGAVWLDNIQVDADGASIFATDFEDGLLPAEMSVERLGAAGDFANLYQGLHQGDADPVNDSFVWAFFDSLTPANDPDPGYEFGIIPGPPYLHNAIESPPLSVDASGVPIEITADTQVLLSFDVYTDMPLDNLIFYTFEVSATRSDGVDCLGYWSTCQTIYHEDDRQWHDLTFDITLYVTDFLAGEYELLESIIVRLVALDMYGPWANIYGDGLGSNQAPYFDNVRVMLVEDTLVDAETPAPRPMLAAHPNPFNPSTRVDFALEADGPVDLAVYDITGRRVRTLAAREMTAGSHELEWDGRDDAGRELAGGVYLLRFEAADTVENEKLVLLK